jgi:pilus assembly protein Flp/PilA
LSAWLRRNCARCSNAWIKPTQAWFRQRSLGIGRFFGCPDRQPVDGFCLKLTSGFPNFTFNDGFYSFPVADGHIRTRVLLGAIGSYYMSQLLTRFWKNESGATAIEYGLIAAGISVAIIAAVNGIGTKLNTSFGSISTQLK